MDQQAKNTLNLSALEQASDWLVTFSSGDSTDQDRDAFNIWLETSTDNQTAWVKAEALMNKLGQLPPSLAMTTLNRPVDASRRALLNKFMILFLLAPVGWGSWRFLLKQGWTADHYTARGEQRQLQLADGSQLTLNTDTAINVSFDNEQRLITLVRGELLIQTGKENRYNDRPLRVQTEEGMLEALGTKFSVHQQSNQTHIAVLEGAVQIVPKRLNQHSKKVLMADMQTVFTKKSIETERALSSAQFSWTKGMLLADNMRLADFIIEISRYRKGIIRLEPTLSELLISGSYPLVNIDQTLNMLVMTYPINLKSQFAGYVTVLSAKKD